MKLKLKGKFVEGRKLMMARRRMFVTARNRAEKELKEKQKKGLYTDPIRRDIDHLNKQIQMNSVQKVLPARLENIVFNFRIYDRFVKKLRGYYTRLEILDDSIVLKYGKRPGVWTGSLTLYDTSKYYEGIFTDIPEVEVIG